MFSIEAVIADTQPVYVAGLKNLFDYMEDVRVKVKEKFSDGRALVDYLEEHSPELLILDLNLTGMDGFEVLQWISRNKLNIRLLVLTAYDDERMLKKARQLGAHGYLFKTAQPTTIARAIKSVLTGQLFFAQQSVNPGRNKDIAGVTAAVKLFKVFLNLG
jgi:DNA-binding NarL/FixJ family response regulator